MPITKIKYGKWSITCNKGLWEAEHAEPTKIYVNFSQEPDTSAANLKRILDTPALRREQDVRVLKRLKELEDFINGRLMPDPSNPQENIAKPGEELALGKALWDVMNKRLFYLTSDPEKYLEYNRREAEIEAKIRARLEVSSQVERESFFGGSTAQQLEILALLFGLRPSDYGVTLNSALPRPLTETGMGKCWALLEEALKNLKPS